MYGLFEFGDSTCFSGFMVSCYKYVIYIVLKSPEIVYRFPVAVCIPSIVFPDDYTIT